MSCSASCRRLSACCCASSSNCCWSVLAGFVLTQSYFYARQMLRIGRTSDMAGVPMWIPHGTVALGFALILIVAVWGLVRMARRMPERSAADEVKL